MDELCKIIKEYIKRYNVIQEDRNYPHLLISELNLKYLYIDLMSRTDNHKTNLAIRFDFGKTHRKNRILYKFPWIYSKAYYEQIKTYCISKKDSDAIRIFLDIMSEHGSLISIKYGLK